MLAIPDKIMWLALALTMTLALTPADPLSLWDRAHSASAVPLWFPVAVLVLLMVGSLAFGIACPEQFALAFGQDPAEPRRVVALLGP